MSLNTLRSAIVCMLVTACSAGEIHPLQGTRTLTSDVFAPARYSHFRCDTDGNVYLRVYTGERTSPVVKISPEGKLLTTFKSEKTDEFVGFQDFWVSSNGEVFILAEKSQGEGAILVFDGDGKLKDDVSLEAPLRPNQLAVFQSGDFLVGGREVVEPNAVKSMANGSPFLGLFNSRGQLLKRIQFSGDVKPNKKQPATRADLNYAESVVASASELGDDGSVYFVRHTPSGPIYKISNSGKIAKTLRLKPPEGMILSTVKFSKGMAAVEYSKNATDDGRSIAVIVQLVDLSSGAKVAEYSSVPPMGPDLACFEPNTFVFIASDENGHLTFTTATSQ